MFHLVFVGIPLIKVLEISILLFYAEIAKIITLVLNFISKAMETIITKQLFAFLKTNCLFSDHQYGFRQARSTGDLLTFADHAWSSALESYGESRVIFLLIFPRPLISSGTKVFLLNCLCPVSNPPLLNGFLAFYLVGQLQLGLMVSSLGLMLLPLVCLRAL